HKLLQELRKFYPNTEIQLLRADRVAGPEHIIFAASAAIDAYRQHRERSHTLAVELLLYASCQRQISKAIQFLGLSSHTRNAVLVALTGEESPLDLRKGVDEIVKARPDDSVIEISSEGKASKLMKAYDISRKSIDASRLPGESEDSVLKRLIIERSALLAVEK